MLPLIFGGNGEKGAVLSFKFDDDFDSLTEERKAAYLSEIAAALGVDSVDLKSFRRGSVIVDINVDKETAERLARDSQTLGASLDAEVSVTSSSPSSSASHHASSNSHSSSHSNYPRGAVHRDSSKTGTAYYDAEDASSLNEATIVLQSGDHVEIDRGLFALAQVSGVVFHDLNANGFYDASSGNTGQEVGVEGIVVNFVRESGEVVAEMKTDKHGQYHFSEKEPGNYYVSIQLSSGYVLSPLPDPLVLADLQSRSISGVRSSGSGASRTVTKSDFEPSKAGNSSVFALHSGSKVTELNAAIYRPAQIRGFAWEDITGEGIFRGKSHQQTAGVGSSAEAENAAEGVSALGPLAMADLVLQTDPDLPIVATVALVANGAFLFDNVMPGTYKLKFSLPSDFYFVRASLEQSSFTLGSGQLRDVDVGYYRPVVVSGSIYEDLNALGFVTGKETEARRHIRGATIELIAETSETRENNKYLSEHRKAISSALVTSASGNFRFEGFAPGVYHLRFQPPLGYKRSMRLTAGELAKIRVEDPEALSSDAEQASGLTQSYLITSGSTFKKQDGSDITVCMYTVATIGGYVWNDANADGVFDEDERPLPNVQVKLSNAEHTFQTSAITNERGHYLFKNLEPGRYLQPVVVPPANHQHSNIRINFKYVDSTDRRLYD